MHAVIRKNQLYSCASNAHAYERASSKSPKNTRRMQSLFTLCTVNLQPFTQLAEGLLPRAACRGAEDQLGVELPVLRDVPGLLHASVDQRVVVLQVGAEALSHQSGPGD